MVWLSFIPAVEMGCICYVAWLYVQSKWTQLFHEIPRQSAEKEIMDTPNVFWPVISCNPENSSSDENEVTIGNAMKSHGFV